MDSTTTEPRPTPAFNRLIEHGWGLLSAGLFVLVLVSLGSFLGRLAWPLDLASSFRIQYLQVALVSAIIFGLGRRKKATTVSTGLALILALSLLPLYLGHPQADWEGPSCKVLLANVRTSNTDHERLVKQIQFEDPDIVLLLEVNDAWLRDLEALRTQYPQHMEIPEEDNFGIALYTRLPAKQLENHPLGVAQLPTVHAQLEWNGRPFHLLGTHPLPPGSPDTWTWRNDQLREIARFRSTCEGPFLLLGDLNTTPWSPFFRVLMQEASLADARKGFGLQTTWPTFLAPMRIPIDHCLLSGEWAVRDFRRGQEMGSDHFPVVVTCSWKSN